MSSPNDIRISRTLGALLGVHCGDSLGATLEFKPWSQIIRQYPHGLREIIGGGTLNWPAGQATDDTDLTRAVLLAYLDYEENKHKQAGSTQSQSQSSSVQEQEFNIAKAAAEYAFQWNEGNWPGRKKGTRPIDIGNATRTGLQHYKKIKNPAKSGAGIDSAGNGSLMRCIPTGLFASTAERRRDESMAISEFTHNDPRCTVACAAYNETVAALVSGDKTPQEAVDMGKTMLSKDGETLPLAKIASDGPRGDVAFNSSGYVLNSLKLAIAALLDPRPFEDVLVDVVRIGGDSDTNGAIAGGLLGARDGVEKIPQRWLEKLQFRGEFEEAAIRILRLQQGSG
ncbi:ADP-ribosylglycohydrolase family protein [Byssothecium circinans]|uniref:ADP-ribosylhydrolase ARH3 n=1 Tax=Byssothecium circinans TaxID=147558 RepID=A0A6A5TT04_9PLEO|nr:ADP-ribosylglycohydrolase family protein [Byssothecium circinans]